MKEKVTTHTVKTKSLGLTKADLLRALDNSGITIPPTASVFIRVPSGGDWSGMDLELNEQRTVNVQWVESSTEEGKKL